MYLTDTLKRIKRKKMAKVTVTNQEIQEVKDNISNGVQYGNNSYGFYAHIDGFYRVDYTHPEFAKTKKYADVNAFARAIVRFEKRGF